MLPCRASILLRKYWSVIGRTLLCNSWAWDDGFKIHTHTCLWLFRDWILGRHAALLSRTDGTRLLRCTWRKLNAFCWSCWKRRSVASYMPTSIITCIKFLLDRTLPSGLSLPFRTLHFFSQPWVSSHRVVRAALCYQTSAVDVWCRGSW